MRLSLKKDVEHVIEKITGETCDEIRQKPLIRQKSFNWFNRFICFLKGHIWEKQYKEHYKFYVCYTQCKRCDKILKETP